MKNKIIKYAIIAFLIFGVIVLVFVPNKGVKNVYLTTNKIEKDKTDNYDYTQTLWVDSVSEEMFDDELFCDNECGGSVVIKTEDEVIEYIETSQNYFYYKDNNKIKVYDKNANEVYVIDVPTDYETYFFGDDEKGIFGMSAIKGNEAVYYNLLTNKVMYEGKYNLIYVLSRDYLEAVVLEEDEYDVDDQKEVVVLSTSEEKEILKKTNKDNDSAFYGFDHIYDKNYDYYVFEVSVYGGLSTESFYKEIYDKNFKVIYSTKYDLPIDYDSKTEETTILMNNNIAKDGSIYVYENNTFKKFDTSGKEVKSVKVTGQYITMANEYLVLIKNKNLELLDINGKEILLTKLNGNMYIHPGLSGWYSENNKEGVYVVVEVDDGNVDEIYKECKKHNNCDDMTKQEFLENDIGYEYYYIPKTGEVGKIGTYIGGYAKPVLYLYPQKETNVTVTFDKENNLTTTYPKYNGSWNVKAYPNGDLYDKDNKYYYGLYWEEDLNHRVDFSEGFYVTKDNAIEFLESKLEYIGLNPKERNEFIMYWLPVLEKNEKSLVYFELTKERNEYSKINITPTPDSMLRLAIHVKKVSGVVKIKEQKLERFNRVGFSAVEWGGVTY